VREEQGFQLEQGFQVKGVPFRVIICCDYFSIEMCIYDAFA